MLKRPPTPTADLLAEASKYLYGDEEWISALSRELNTNPRTIKAWLSGKTQLKPDHPIMHCIYGILIERRDRAHKLAAQIWGASHKAA